MFADLHFASKPAYLVEYITVVAVEAACWGLWNAQASAPRLPCAISKEAGNAVFHTIACGSAGN